MASFDKSGNNNTNTLSPANVLLSIREQDKMPHRELRELLGITSGPSDFRNQHLKHVLADLESAALIEVSPKSIESPFTSGHMSEECTYHVSPQLEKLQGALQLSLHRLRDEANPPHRDAVNCIQRMADELEAEMPDVGYKADTIASFRELGNCLQACCYIATLALGGKLLELAIKHHMIMTDHPFEDNWMLGTLLQKMKENAEVYQDPSLRNVATIINTSRIPAVHAKREIPIPSEEQALMVVNAVLDVTRRLVLAKETGPSLAEQIKGNLEDS